MDKRPDDITYQSLAKVWDPTGELEYDPETISRMDAYLASRQPTASMNPDQQTARRRMALFPKAHSEVLFVVPHLWVPVVKLRARVFILPGVPTLFTQLVDALVANYVPLPPTTEQQRKITISSPSVIISQSSSIGYVVLNLYCSNYNRPKIY